MTGFNVTDFGAGVIVESNDFTLIFTTDTCGITSFLYDKGGNEHNCVGNFAYPLVLFAPFFTALSVPGGILWPDGGTSTEVIKNFDWFVQIKQSGYLRNVTIPVCTDYIYNVTWYIWPSGRIGCKLEAKNLSGSMLTLSEEAYRLNPANDSDINPERDTVPNLEWFGFWSNNTGNDPDDLSHDTICVPYIESLDTYGVSGKINRIYDSGVTWLNNETLTRWFLLALSVEGSWGDSANSTDLENHGDDISADLKNPDPLDGSANAGDVLTGTRVDSGFDEYTSAITVSA